MNLSGKSILITGGSAGIGLESARQFLSQGANVIICGRDQKKLEQAKKTLPAVTIIKCDVSNVKDVEDLYNEVEKLGGIDILYNNAGVGTPPLNHGKPHKQHHQNAEYEMNINYLAVIRLNNLFMNMLKERKEAAIINTTSILSIIPGILAATYSASKAALSSYTNSLRVHLEILQTTIKVFELLPPLVDTEMTTDIDRPKISTEVLVNALVFGILKDQYTIRVGDTKKLYTLSRFFPKKAFSLLNDKNLYGMLK